LRAIVLAAGEGTRLRPHTLDRPKCLVELAGRSLLDHQLATLARCGVRDVTLVTGYRAEQLEARGLPTRHNPDWSRTNMVASLMCAADRLDGGEDVLIAYADIVYEPRVLDALRCCEAAQAIPVDLRWEALWRTRLEDPLADAETLKLDAVGDVIELGRKPKGLDEVQGQYMGLIRLSAAAAKEWVADYHALDPAGPYEGRTRANMYMTTFLQLRIDAGHALRAVPVESGWLEVDTARDLATYAALQAEGRLARFWRAEAASDPA
jgi:choline kinase